MVTQRLDQVYVQPANMKLESVTKAQKLMHRFQACNVEKIMDDVERQS